MVSSKWFSRITYILIITIIAIGIFYLLQQQKYINKAASTPNVFDSDINNRFIKSYALNMDLNSGISIVRSPFLIAVDGTTPSPNFIDFVVFNHTNEPVVFPNQGFGLRTFVYDNTMEGWSEIHIQKPAPTEVTLPGKLERYDFNINNSWAISERFFTSVEQDKIRIFIAGVGKETGKLYAALYDAQLYP